MFTEVLRIKPQLDPGTASSMEKNLSSRFARVASRFGHGLKSVLKGSLLGISLGLLSKLLNPLNDLEDKVKRLLDETEDLHELSDSLGTTPGQLRRLQDVSASIGVTPDRLKELLLKYAEAVEKGRDELETQKLNPQAELSGSTNVLRNFLDEKDLAEGFFKFLQSLNTLGQSKGREVPNPDGRGMRFQSGAEARRVSEKEVFGDVQHGSARRLIEADFARQFSYIKEPDAGELGKAAGKLGWLEARRQAEEVKRKTQDFLSFSKAVNENIVVGMEKAVGKKDIRENKQIANDMENLQRAAQGIEDMKNLLTDASTFLTRGIGELVIVLQKIANSPLIKYGAGLLGKGK